MIGLDTARAMVGGYYSAARMAVAPYLDVVKLVAGLALVIATGIFIWRVTVWHEDHKRIGPMEAELADAKAQLEQAAASQAAAAKAYVGEIERVNRLSQETNTHAAEIERDLQARLAQSETAGRDLARRLARSLREPDRHAGQVATASLAGSATVDADASGEPGYGVRVEQATAAHFAACRRDADRLTGWQVWYAKVKADWLAAGYPVEGWPDGPAEK